MEKEFHWIKSEAKTLRYKNLKLINTNISETINGTIFENINL